MGKKRSVVPHNKTNSGSASVYNALYAGIYVLVALDKEKTSKTPYKRLVQICVIIAALTAFAASVCKIAEYFQYRPFNVPAQHSTHAEKPGSGTASEKPNVVAQLPVGRTHVRDLQPRNLAPLSVKTSVELELNGAMLTNIPIDSSLYDAFSTQRNEPITSNNSVSGSVVALAPPAVVLPKTISLSQSGMNREEPGLAYSKFSVNIEPEVLVHSAITETCYSAIQKIIPCPAVR